MKEKGMKLLRRQIAIGYALIILLIGGIVWTSLYEWQQLEALEAESIRIHDLRGEVHQAYARLVNLSLMGETILEWTEEDHRRYRHRRLAIDSMLCRFNAYYQSEQMDSLRRLLADKETQLGYIKELFDRQTELNEQIAHQVPTIARQSTQAAPKKRSGFLGLFGKKQETPATTMLYTLNREVVAKLQAQQKELAGYADSLAVRNTQINRQLKAVLEELDGKVQANLSQREKEITATREQSLLLAGVLTGIVLLLLVISYLIICRDMNRISNYKRETAELIRKLKFALAENKELIRARQRMMLTVTHELRTPLTAIGGYAEMIPDEDDRGKRAEHARYIRQASGRMASLLNTLLSFFRLDSGKEQITNRPFRLQSITDTLQADFQPQAEAKDLVLTVESGNDAVVMGDKERIIQIGANLMSNAIKFTAAGTVTLRTAYDKGVFTLSVEDTGTGIGKAEQANIFYAFERLSNAATQDGFGLGLSIVRSLVNMLGGTVKVESEKGKGSRFTVELPLLAADKLKAEKTDATIEVLPPFPYSVAVLDNDELMLAMMQEMLLRCGAACDTCSNVGDLMEMIRRKDYDLLITDLKMPEINGYEVLELLRSCDVGNSRTIPVMVVTATGSCQAEELLAQGFNTCLFKPFSLAELVNAAKSGIGEKNFRRNNEPDLAVLLAYGNKEEMLDKLIRETEKEMEEVKRAGKEEDTEALNEWIHHLWSSWSVIHADKPLTELYYLLRKKGKPQNLQQAVAAVLAQGDAIIRLAKETKEAYGKNNRD